MDSQPNDNVKKKTIWTKDQYQRLGKAIEYCTLLGYTNDIPLDPNINRPNWIQIIKIAKLGNRPWTGVRKKYKDLVNTAGKSDLSDIHSYYSRLDADLGIFKSKENAACS